MSQIPVAALYVRADSVYKTLGVDCYDIERDASTWKGGNSLIAHPPCRSWGRLAQFSKPRPGERDLAISAVKLVRRFGGVLEHPAQSKLWPEMGLPSPGVIDNYGGFTLCVNQSWFGHKAEKKTLLYIVGCNYCDLPPIPISFDAVQYVVRPAKNGKGAKIITKSEREATPVLFAKWLIDLALRCQKAKPS